MQTPNCLESFQSLLFFLLTPIYTDYRLLSMRPYGGHMAPIRVSVGVNRAIDSHAPDWIPERHK